MKIIVIAPPSLGIPDVAQDGSLAVPEGASIGSVVNTFTIDPELKRHLPVAVNGDLVTRSHRLSEGDELTVLFPFVGG